MNSTFDSIGKDITIVKGDAFMRGFRLIKANLPGADIDGMDDILTVEFVCDGLGIYTDLVYDPATKVWWMADETIDSTLWNVGDYAYQLIVTYEGGGQYHAITNGNLKIMEEA